MFKKSFIPLFIAIFLVACGGGGGDDSSQKPEKIDTNSSSIDSRIASELKNATTIQKDFIQKYNYYGFIKITEGYNEQIGNTTYECTGVSFAGGKKQSSQLLIVTIDNENQTASETISKIGDKYIQSIEDEEDKSTTTLQFVDNEQYLVGSVISYQKEIKKNCKMEIYLKRK